MASIENHGVSRDFQVADLQDRGQRGVPARWPRHRHGDALAMPLGHLEGPRFRAGFRVFSRVFPMFNHV